MIVQTRSEKNGLMEFPTVSDAMKAEESDPSIWKISFELPNGERVRLVKVRNLAGSIQAWIYEPLL